MRSLHVELKVGIELSVALAGFHPLVTDNAGEVLLYALGVSK